MERKLGMAGFEFREQPLETIFQKARDMGFSSMEFGAETIMDAGISTVKEYIDKYGIILTAIGVGFWNKISDDEVPQLQETFLSAIDTAQQLNIPHVFTYFGGNKKHDYKKGIDLFTKRIEPCLKEAINKNVIILVENHFSPEPNEATADAKTCLEFLESINSKNFKLNFDPANFYVAGEEAYPYAYEKLKEHIRTIHLKDVIKFDSEFYGKYDGRILVDVHYGEFICVAMGEGGMNFEGLISALIRDKFNGPMTIELHVPHNEREIALKKGYDFCQKFGW